MSGSKCKHATVGPPGKAWDALRGAMQRMMWTARWCKKRHDDGSGVRVRVDVRRSACERQLSSAHSCARRVLLLARVPCVRARAPRLAAVGRSWRSVQLHAP